MTVKNYDWEGGAFLKNHSVRKHEILRKYFEDYLFVRCGSLPQQSKFRLAIIDGFAGGGYYKNGHDGSPVIFIKTLVECIKQINVKRAVKGFAQIEIDCLFLFNDSDQKAIEALNANLAPYIQERYKHLHIDPKIFNKPFEEFYPEAKALLKSKKYKNVLFNVDPCGYSVFERNTIVDILQSFDSAEVFLTFMISALLAFLQKNNNDMLHNQLKSLNLSDTEENSLVEQLKTEISNDQFLGAAEQLVFNAFKNIAAYVSMFSINNPQGWRYWLVHFANSHRARQVYNDVLHKKSSAQAHFGRSGLSMLSYDPRDETNQLYLFDMSCRDATIRQLHEEIPDFIGAKGEAMKVMEFYRQIYNLTPAHSDDILKVLHESDSVKVLSEAGNERRKANSIKNDDIIVRSYQGSFKF